VGSEICAECHPNVAASYSKTAMARSITTGENFASPDGVPMPFTIFDRETSEYFEVSSHDGALFQSQYALDRGGKQIFRQTWKIAYVIGSGHTGVGFLIRRGGYLFEAPLSYYAESKFWSFSPGYELHNYAFRRPVVAECTGCHSGRPQPVYGVTGLYRNPPFLELGVGCENCHGPGELHVNQRRAGLRLTGQFDDTIVNPARLSGWMSDNICMKCHQGGDVRVEQPDRHDQDFRPGTPLENVVEILKVPPIRDSTARNPALLEHYYSMILSKCYRASAGSLRCTTCHNPHFQPVKATSAAYYRDRCMSCHNTRPCKSDASERGKTDPPDNCAGCHMPKRSLVTIAHAALTEHRVLVSSNAPLPEDAFSSTDFDSGLVRLTARPGNPRTPIPDIVLFQAYAELIHDGHEEFRPRMDEVLARLSRTTPNDARVLSALAGREVQKNSPEAFEVAARYLTKAVKTGNAQGEDFLLLADLDSRANKHGDAIDVLRAGQRLNPYLPKFAESLAAEYMKLGDYAVSTDVIRHGLELFPDDKALRKLMNDVQSATVDGMNGSH
jgi:predicted CXXCH cytochrome family protein